MSTIQQLEDLKEWSQDSARYERRLNFRGGQLVQPGPGYKPGGLVEPGVMNYGKEDKLGKNISYIKEAKHYNYKKPVYRFSITFPPGMKKNEVNMIREATPENLKMMKKLRNKLQGEIDTFYGPNRITTEDVLKLRDKHPALTHRQIAEKLKGKIGARGNPFTESSVKKATIDAGKKGKYGQLTSLGRTLEQLKEEATKLPLGKKYLDDYNKTKNKDEALKVFRNRIKTGLHHHFTSDPAKAATWRAKWAKTEKGALSIKKSLEKHSALRTAVYGNFNPGRDPEHRLFHALWRSSQQAGSRWKLISKKPDKWTQETARGAEFLDTKNKKPITLDGLKKYMDTTPDVGSYKAALKPFKEKAALQKYLVNYKGKEYKLGNLLNERLWTGDDWKYFSEGTSEIVVNHPDKVKDNWWKGEVAYKDANMRLNDLERTFASQMRRADTDIDRQKVLKKNFAKEVSKLEPITYKGPHGAFGKHTGEAAMIKSMVKPMYKKTGDKALSRTLNTLVKQLGCGTSRLASQGGGDIDCFTRGLEKIKTKNIATQGDAVAMKKIVQIGAKKGAARTALMWLGPLGLGGDVLFEAGDIAVQMLGGKPLDESLRSNWITGAFIDQTEKEARDIKLFKQTGPGAKTYVQGSEAYEKLQKMYKALQMMKQKQSGSWLMRGKEITDADIKKMEEDVAAQERYTIMLDKKESAFRGGAGEEEYRKASEELEDKRGATSWSTAQKLKYREDQPTSDRYKPMNIDISLPPAIPKEKQFDTVDKMAEFFIDDDMWNYYKDYGWKDKTELFTEARKQDPEFNKKVWHNVMNYGDVGIKGTQDSFFRGTYDKAPTGHHFAGGGIAKFGKGIINYFKKKAAAKAEKQKFMDDLDKKLFDKKGNLNEGALEKHFQDMTNTFNRQLDHRKQFLQATPPKDRKLHATGGITNIRRPWAVPPESGPMPQGGGLSSQFNRVKKITG